jgi:hypothetical protein
MIRRKDVSSITALAPAREPVDFIQEQCYLKFWFRRSRSRRRGALVVKRRIG